MLKKMKKYRYIILVCIISIIYLSLTSARNSIFAYGASCDDYLILDSTKNLLNFDWLGNFTGVRLAKGPGAEVFIAMLNCIGLTFTQGHFLLYLFSSILFAYVLKKVVKNDFVRLIVFAFVLFNPAMFSNHVLRIYRDGLYSSLLLLVVSCAFGIFFNYKEKATKLVPYLIGLGVFGTWMAITREETLWIAPFTIGSGIITCLFIIFDKNCLEKKKKVLLYLIPICIYFVAILGICTLNKIAYGEFIRIEQNTKAFKDFEKAASSVDVEETNIRVPLSKEAREKIYEVSPSFAKFRDYIEGPSNTGFVDAGVVPGEIEDGWFMWTIFFACDANGLTTDAKTMNNYLRQITKEINEAFEDGKLKKEDKPESIFDKDNFNNFIKSLKDSFEYQVKVNSINLTNEIDGYYQNPAMANQYAEFSEITGNTAVTPLTANYKTDRIKIRIMENITKFYQKISKPLFILGIVIYFLMILRFFIIKPRFENYKELIVLTSLILLYILRLVVIAYTEIAKFPAIDVMYLSSTYSIQFAFEILALVFGITEIAKIVKNKFIKK